VHHTAETLHLLAFDRFRALSEKVPTRLDVERQARALTEELALSIALAWSALPTSEVSLQRLARLLQDLQIILKALMAEDLGRVALQENVQQIEVTTGSKLAVKLEGRMLQIVGEVSHGDFVSLERSPLQIAIEKLL
jgi:hypothetical protein